jgi:hypothetical protein
MGVRHKYQAARSILLLAMREVRNDASQKAIVEFVDGLIDEESSRLMKIERENRWKKLKSFFSGGIDA